jgi:hypothetical protein
MAMVTAMMAVVSNNNHFLAKSQHRLHEGH